MILIRSSLGLRMNIIFMEIWRRAYFDGFGDKGYDPSVWFPLLIIQDFQVAYNYSRWSFGTSLTNIVSNVLSNSYWKFGVNVSFYK